MITIKDVAKKAQVAPSTVSKVLNGYDRVSDETKTKVNKAVKELGYFANGQAKALAKGEFHQIGLIVNINNDRQSIDELNMQYILGATTEAKNLGINVITIFADTFVDMNKQQIIGYLNSLSINCLVVYSLTKEQKLLQEIIEEQVFLSVVVDAPIVNKRTSSISIDNFSGQYEVAKTVVEKNSHQKVLYLAGDQNGFVTDLRLRGIERLQREYNFNLEVAYCDWSEKKARDFIVGHENDYDIVVCASDLMALGAVNGLTQLDVFHPVTGFDGIALLGYCPWKIWTVKQNFYEISKSAIKELKLLIDSKLGRSILLEYKVCTIDYEDVIY